jgi:hypothetical protein
LVTHEAECITCIAVAASSDASLVTLGAAKVCVAELASIDAGTATQVIISASCVAQTKIGTVQDLQYIHACNGVNMTGLQQELRSRTILMRLSLRPYRMASLLL